MIVGGGLVGLWTAYFIKRSKPNASVSVWEKGILPSGASTRNAGFACFGSVSEILDDLEQRAENEVWELVEKRYRGLCLLRDILGDKYIGYEPLGGFEIFLPGDKATRCLDQMSFLNKALKQISPNDTYVQKDEKIRESGFGQVQTCIENKLEGQLHTGKMVERLMHLCREAGVRFYTGASITGWEENEKEVHVQVNDLGVVRCQQLLFAVNGFASSLLPVEDVQPARAQVLITHPIPGLDLKGSFHYDRGYNYFRNVGDRILLGGGRNLDVPMETTSKDGLTPLIQSHLDELLTNIIHPKGKVSIDMRWSGTMGVGSKKSPIVQEIGKRTTCAVRMGGMGVALGSLVGQELAEKAMRQ